MEKRIFHSKLISAKSAYSQSLKDLKIILDKLEKMNCPQKAIKTIEKRILRLEQLSEQYKEYKTSKFKPSISDLELLVFQRYVEKGDIEYVVSSLDLDGVKDKNRNKITKKTVIDIIKNRPEIVPIDCERLVLTAYKIYKHNNSKATVDTKGEYPLESIQGIKITNGCTMVKGKKVSIRKDWVEVI